MTVTSNQPAVTSFQRCRSLAYVFGLGALVVVAVTSSALASKPLLVGAAIAVGLADSILATRRPRSVAFSLGLDSTILILIALLVGLPPGTYVILGVLLATAGLALLPPTTAIRIIVFMAVGLTIAVVGSEMVDQRRWESGEVAVILGGTLVSAAPLLWWLVRTSGARVGQLGVLSRHLDDLAADLQFHDTLLDQARSAIVASDTAGVITYANEFAAKLSGYETDELVGASLPDLLVPREHQDRLDQVMRSVQETGHWEGEFSIRRKDGSVLEAHVIDQVLRAEDGSSRGVISVALDLTRQKQAEEARIRTLSQLNRVLATTDEGIYGLDVDGMCTFINRAGAETLGWRPEELLGKHMHGFVHGRRQDGSPYPEQECVIYRAYSRGQAASLADDVMTKRDGTVIRVEQSCQPIIEDGEVTGAVVSFRDMTKTLEIRRHIRFQASLLDQVRSAVIATDLSGAITYWNRYAEEMYGWSADEVIGQPIVAVTVPEDQASKAGDIMQSIAETGSWNGEFTVRRRDGSTFPSLVANSTITDESGTPIGVIGVSTDLSELRTIERKARERGDIARTVLNSVHFPVALIDGRGTITTVNTAWIRSILENGGDPEKCGEGANYLEVCRKSAPYEPQAAEALSGIQSVLDGNSTQFQLEYECHSPTEKRWFRLEVTPVPGVGAVVAHWNVTDSRLAREALQALVDSKDQFVASVSHELRTPLTAVVGLTQELVDHRDRFTEAEIDELLLTIADQSREMGYIVEDLLVAARADIDRISVRPTSVDLRSLAREVASTVAPEATITGDDLAVARVDLVRARQIVRNLLTNATRYGGPNITVAVETTGSHVSLSVEDDGEGIPPGIAARIFDAYYQAADRTGLPGSVGLGLYVSRRLAIIMGGDLSYRYDDRSIFELILPAAAGEK